MSYLLYFPTRSQIIRLSGLKKVACVQMFDKIMNYTNETFEKKLLFVSVLPYKLRKSWNK